MTKKDKKSGAHINRRSFLKGIAATGAMATMTEGYMLGERLAEIEISKEGRTKGRV